MINNFHLQCDAALEHKSVIMFRKESCLYGYSNGVRTGDVVRRGFRLRIKLADWITSILE
jgi:hypothetical protein